MRLMSTRARPNLSEAERAEVRERFSTTFQQIRTEVEAGERRSFTLDEINAEIRAARADRKLKGRNRRVGGNR